ncbi:PspC domain-containing protein [Sphingobacterium oryzagri]|uniref:PspC domain-containing protein n=1 Tax=Sphingobacterium oryzagri TaxID=3025669 RepID=A0ABY7WGK6_9SPHI|nr:PspC domain-containing protein [Sphingobacterium sp. KACC 22765]WDF68615.1 PspC domain-containing protein [Sphingobacterium sp. KACC 22765]
MNKTIIININSIVFHIEEDAYETLRAYMIDIKKHFGNSAESKEILEDIENRIAEMFNERIQTGRKEVINLEDVQEVIERMGKVSDFEQSEEAGEGMSDIPEDAYNRADHIGRKLMRDPDDKVLGGVCSGLAHYFGMEPRWLRVLLVLFVLIGGSGFLVYLILWIVMPVAETRADKMSMRGEVPNLQNFKKSFDEEVRSFSSEFSGAGEHISRSARSAGNAMGGCLGLIGKLIAWLMLIFTGLNILGLFIFYVFNMMNLFGLENPILFPPLAVLSTDDAIIALTFGTLAVTIPFLALFLWLIRVLFKTDKVNNYLSLTMFAAWIVSIVGVIYYCVYAAQDFREKSTINIQKNITVQPVYHFTEKDVRILDASEKDSLRSKFNMQLDGQDLRNYLHDNIAITFESIDSLGQPYIQYNYSAHGKSYQLAAERAKNIVYEAVQEGKTILFPSHFLLRKNALDRDQQVSVTVYLPRGAKVILEREIEHKLRDISYWECLNNYADHDHQRYTEWTMTATGLVCAQVAPEKDNDKDDDDSEGEELDDVNDESAAAVSVTDSKESKTDSVITIDGSNVTIEVKNKETKVAKKKSAS